MYLGRFPVVESGNESCLKKEPETHESDVEEQGIGGKFSDGRC